MNAPWKEYPEYQVGSIAWRMGDGEDYGMRFGDWFRNLTEEKRLEFIIENPEPADWEGFYSKIIS